MNNIAKEELKHQSKELENRRECPNYEKQIFEVFHFSILQYAIHMGNHKQIAKLREYYEKQGYDFNKYFTSAEKQLSKIENPEITLKSLLNSLTNIIKSF